MRFTYCPTCGTKLIAKEIGDEGVISYCEQCEFPMWDIPRTCILCAVLNEFGEIALLRQDYISTEHLVCVAGVMKIGESAEETICREVQEELGLTVEKLEYVQSYADPNKELLMLGYQVTVAKAPFTFSGEVDDAQWFAPEDAPAQLLEDSIAQKLVLEVIKRKGLGDHLCSI